MAATITANQKSKNLSLSRKPKSSQFFYQWVCPLNLEVVTCSSTSVCSTPAFRLKYRYSFDTKYICRQARNRLMLAITITARWTPTRLSEGERLLSWLRQSCESASRELSTLARDCRE